jgi:hypothetical protein
MLIPILNINDETISRAEENDLRSSLDEVLFCTQLLNTYSILQITKFTVKCPYFSKNLLFKTLQLPLSPPAVESFV